MEAASLALSIAALYTTCRECYTFFTSVKAAEVDSSAHFRELEIQQSILKAWGFHWQIQSEDINIPGDSIQARRRRSKLQDYLSSNRFKAEGVFTTLSALADTLSNQDKLVKRYGVRIQPAQAVEGGPQSIGNVELAISDTTIGDVKPVISEVKNRLSVLNQFKWAMKDKDNFKKLIADLRAHSDSLYRLCPENALESMNIYLAMECLARQDSPEGLKWTSQIATAQAKASVNRNRGQELRENSLQLPNIDEEEREMRYLGRSLALFENQVVYVEMRDYRGPPLELTPEQKQRIKRRRHRSRLLKRFSQDPMAMRSFDQDAFDKIYNHSGSSEDDEDEDKESMGLVRPADPELHALIRNFVKTFQGTHMKSSVYGLDIAGMVDHREGEHKGHCSILYKLPGMIGVETQERPAENLRLRAPVTLESLLGNQHKEGIRSTLGARFELARKLVRAVCMLHCSGWLHKNIRAESVIFFPEHVSALQEDRYEIVTEIDVSKPSLTGYNFSRPDDIIRNDQSYMHGRNADTGSSIDIKYSRPRAAPTRTRTDTWEDPTIDRQRTPRIRGRSSVGTVNSSNTLRRISVLEQAKEMNISGFTLDYYQHPAKHADPKETVLSCV